MTRKRNDKHSTEFGLWLREQLEIDSKYGYVATNIDYMWRNYKTGEWMLIEEKRYNSSITKPQRRMFALLNKACKGDSLYKGFHLIQFENTSPDDGEIKIDNKVVTKEELLNFLRFTV